MLLFVLLLVQNIALFCATSGAKFYAASCACYTWYVGPLHEPWFAIENGATVVLLPVQNFVIRFVLLLVRNVVSFVWCYFWCKMSCLFLCYCWRKIV